MEDAKFDNDLLESLEIKPGKKNLRRKGFPEPVAIGFHTLSSNKYYITFKDNRSPSKGWNAMLTNMNQQFKLAFGTFSYFM